MSPIHNLGDVLDFALRNWLPRTQQDGAAVFGAAGERGFNGSSELEHHTAFARSAYRQVDPFDRLFATHVGPSAARAVGNETRTLAAMQRLAVEVVAESLVRSHQVAGGDRLIVVPSRGQRPPILLVMSPSILNPLESRIISDEVDLPLGALKQVLPSVADPRDGTPEGLVLDALLAGGNQALSEAFLIAQPEIVQTRRPRMTRLCVPAPHVAVGRQQEISTAGIYCRDRDGVLGVTACYHGTGPKGTDVSVDGRQSYVKLVNEVQDIVFIPLGGGQSTGPMRGRGGISRDREPARADRASFDGATNQNRSTRIFGTDNGLLRQRPTIMLKVQTDPDTDRGDSGCALIDQQDQVLGFAFERTSYDDYPEFTDWIWAANALKSLDLSPI
jgi:hypothetical protein